MAKKDISTTVKKIIADVRKKGNKALIQYTKKFDRVKLTANTIKVRPSAMKAAYQRLDADKRNALDACARRIQDFHWQEQKNVPKSWTSNKDGVRLGQIFSPIQSVGIYVPGGRFAYPSTVLMTAIPAKLAGVERRAIVTPPKMMRDEILAAAHIAGVTELYQVGGPAGLAGIAIGTETIPKVDLIIGPGNALVTEAKRQLFGEVGIDLLAGPSELVVLADDSADPDFVAADLAAQAEHDPDSIGILISVSKVLMTNVQKRLPKAIRKQCQTFYQSDLSKAVQLANEIAGEHVQIIVRKPQVVLDSLKNGGAFFIGNYSPAVMGDYWAGPSHVLPTGKSARFCSGLSVLTFIKRSSLIEVSQSAFRKGWTSARTVADSEGLRLHARSLSTRIDGGSSGENNEF